MLITIIAVLLVSLLTSCTTTRYIPATDELEMEFTGLDKAQIGSIMGGEPQETVANETGDILIYPSGPFIRKRYGNGVSDTSRDKKIYFLLDGEGKCRKVQSGIRLRESRYDGKKTRETAKRSVLEFLSGFFEGKPRFDI